MSKKSISKDVAYYMRRLYKKGLTTCSGGNVSCKINNKIIAITPSQKDKGRLKWKDIGFVNLDGKNLNAKIKLSMETEMHLAVYRARPDVKAITHAHPPFASSFCISEIPVLSNLTGEARAIIGQPIIAPYQLMGTKNLAASVANAALQTDVILLENHGILTVGKNLYEAFDKMEVFEMSSKIQFITHLMGKYKQLDEQEIKAIDQLMGR